MDDSIVLIAKLLMVSREEAKIFCASVGKMAGWDVPVDLIAFYLRKYFKSNITPEYM